MLGPCLGSSKSSSAEAESEGDDVARVENAASAPGTAGGVALALAGRRGRLVVAGMAPSLTIWIKREERERWREGGGGRE